MKTPTLDNAQDRPVYQHLIKMTNSEKLSALKVRLYGNTAVATYKDTYDIVIKGEHRAHTIIATDTFVNIGGEWKQIASHGSEAK